MTKPTTELRKRSCWATVCKTVRPIYRIVVCQSCVSVTLVYCGQTVGRIKMKRGYMLLYHILLFYFLFITPDGSTSYDIQIKTQYKHKHNKAIVDYTSPALCTPVTPFPPIGDAVYRHTCRKTTEPRI